MHNKTFTADNQVTIVGGRNLADEYYLTGGEAEFIEHARLARAYGAAVVVMDCENGDILALGSAPAFDPNKFVRGISVASRSRMSEPI